MPWELTTSLAASVAMISRAKRVLGEQVAEPIDDLLREVAVEIRRQVLAVGQIGLEEFAEDLSLRVGEQHGELRPRDALAGGAALPHLLGAGEELHVALELAVVLERDNELLVGLDPLCRDLVLLGQDLRLQVVVVEHVLHDVGRAILQQLVPSLQRQLASLDRKAEQNLPVDLVVRGVDAGGVVDEVGVDLAAGPRVLDAPALREAEVAALADDAGTHLRRR